MKNSNINDSKKQEIRNKVLGDIYKGLIFIIVPLAFISWFRFNNLERLDLFFLTLSFPILLAFIHYFQHRINYLLRTWTLIIILYVSGVSAYLQLGVVSIGLMLLFASGIVSVLLLSKKTYIIVLTVNGLSLFVIALLSISHRIRFQFKLRDMLNSPETWAIQLIGYALVVSVVTLGIQRITKYNENFISELQIKNKEIRDKYYEIDIKDKELLDKEEKLTSTREIAVHSEAMYQTLFNSLNELVYSMDLDGKFEIVNDNFLKTLHTSESAILGKTIYDIFKGTDIDAQWENIRERVISTGEKEVQYNTFKDANGKTITYEVTILPIFIDGEIKKLMGTSRNITDLIDKEEAITRLATTDHLTGLKNRIAFKDFVEDKISNYTIGTYPFSLSIIGVDNFKIVNQSIGHLKGDDVIIQIAARLRIIFKDAQIVARIGGDEFAIIHELKDPDQDINAIISNIKEVSKSDFSIDGLYFSLSMSSGIATYPYDGKNYDELFSKADSTLLHNKSLGVDQHGLAEDK